MVQQAGLLCQVSLADSRVAPIGKSIAWVRDHFDERLSRPYLAKLAGMSQAIFYSQFKAATAMTPVQFQKELRLQEARRMLLSEGVDVAQVGFVIGCESPSQFSLEHHRTFGAPLGRDEVQLRQKATDKRRPALTHPGLRQKHAGFCSRGGSIALICCFPLIKLQTRSISFSH